MKREREPESTDPQNQPTKKPNTMPQRIAFITGANRTNGLGFNLGVKLFKESNFKVILGSRTEEGAAEAKVRFPEADIQILDIEDNQSIDTAVAQIQAQYGRIDVLVNNAGMNRPEGNFEFDDEMFYKLTRIHYLGPRRLIQNVLPIMKAQGYGRIINVSSKLGSIADRLNPESLLSGVEGVAYRATKTLLNSLTATVAVSIESDVNIKVNSICPGWVKTSMGGEEAPLSIDEGIQIQFDLATNESPDAPHGKFLNNSGEIPW
eukprot:TRINITY_DN3304_c2_g1_i1.p1 TRINITY_DN3304_c2_g1~~TRINITY_DN3304_c2_g1_i1.p1  ORF type:complete len:270 (+),score=56.51 TRINITY_DN3304_c2_g1_i1:24-812(+)